MSGVRAPHRPFPVVPPWILDIEIEYWTLNPLPLRPPPSPPRPHPDTLRGRDPRLGSGWTRFPTHFVVGTRSPCASPKGLGEKVGGVLRGGFSRALVPPTTKRVGGLRVGARAGMRYAAESAASPTPPPIRVRPDTLRGQDSLTRAAQNRRGRRICAGACPSAPSKAIFRSKSVALGPKMAPAPQFCPKNGPRRRCKAAGNSSRAFSLREKLGTTCFRRPACQARTHDRACHRPDRAGAFGTGVRPSAFRGTIS